MQWLPQWTWTLPPVPALSASPCYAPGEEQSGGGGGGDYGGMLHCYILRLHVPCSFMVTVRASYSTAGDTDAFSMLASVCMK